MRGESLGRGPEVRQQVASDTHLQPSDASAGKKPGAADAAS